MEIQKESKEKAILIGLTKQTDTKEKTEEYLEEL